MDSIDLQWFAAEDEGRTEEPSEYKLKKAREEGRLPKSQDLNSALVFLVTSILLVFFARSILVNCRVAMEWFFKNCNDFSLVSFRSYYAFILCLVKIVLPIALSGMVMAVLSNIIQNKGFLFTLKTITFKFNKIVPKFGEYFKNVLFSTKGVFNIGKSLIKVFIIVLVAVILLSEKNGAGDNKIQVIAQELIKAKSIPFAIKEISTLVAKILIITAIIFILISIPDYFVNKREFMETMKMTKQEVKEEYKEMEGDPEVKSHLSKMQQDMLKQNVNKAVREADVIITNPTHFAVAMKYDNDVDEAPKVTAKGVDILALQIKQIARDNDIPIIENRPLARGLYNDVEVGDVVPMKYLRVLADIYAKIMSMKKKSPLI